MVHHLGHIVAGAGGGIGFLATSIFIISKLSKGAEIISTFLPFIHGKNGSGKLTKQDHDLLCAGRLDLITTDIKLHTQRLEEGERKFVELREDQRKDFEMLHEDIMMIMGKGRGHR